MATKTLKFFDRKAIPAVRTKALLKRKPIFVEEWAANILVRQLTVSEVKSMRDLAGKMDEDDDATMRLLALFICTEEGERVFGDSDLEWLADNLSIETARSIVQEAMAINGFGEPEKNSEATPSDVSSSVSP